MPYIADRVRETTTTTGTGAITLSGTAATGGFQTFATAFGSGNSLIVYCIVNTSDNTWEVGEGVFNGTTGLTRDSVHSSSNANALVNFAAGTKDVFCTASADVVEHGAIGKQFFARTYQMF